MEKETDRHTIFAPAALPFHMREKLLSDGRLQPEFFSGLVSAFDPYAEAMEAREMQRATFVLAPNGDLSPPTPDERRRLRLLRFPYRYPIR